MKQQDTTTPNSSGRDPGDAIVVTGIGAVTPIGVGKEALWRGALSGRSAVQTIDRFDASPFVTQIAARVRCVRSVHAVKLERGN